jgi:N-acetylneuraminate synthase
LNLEKFKVSDNHELWGGRKLFDLYEEAHTPWEWHKELFDLAESLNVVPFSTPFDLSALNFLEKLNARMYKIASLETGDHLLIQKTAETGKPILISTGATEWEEIEDLVKVVSDTGNRNLILLLCTSSYPAKPQDANLNRMVKLREKFGVEVGLSDHTLGIGVSIAAIALGAVAIEKHFTTSRADGGVDSKFSLEPDEFKSLVNEGNAAKESLGTSDWNTQESEEESRSLRRSLYIVKDVKKGELISQDNVRAIRPNGGMKPKYLNQILGKKFKDSQLMGTALTDEMLEDSN